MWRLHVKVAVASLMLFPAAVHAGEAFPRGVREAPQVQSYDPLKDKFRHLESTLAPHHSTLPGGEFAYYGNRLQQYRYFGRPNTGGIYDALEDYRRKVSPDPVNYRYRW
jgi:hypothetical protein